MDSPSCMSYLRNDKRLARYVLTGEATGTELGCGAYGTVEAVSIIIVL